VRISSASQLLIADDDGENGLCQPESTFSSDSGGKNAPAFEPVPPRRLRHRPPLEIRLRDIDAAVAVVEVIRYDVRRQCRAQAGVVLHYESVHANAVVTFIVAKLAEAAVEPRRGRRARRHRANLDSGRDRVPIGLRVRGDGDAREE